MFYYKSSLIVISLVIISVIHRGFAEKSEEQIECENLMAERGFERNCENGKQNFRDAFEQLTVGQIYQDFYPPDDEEEMDDEKLYRLFKRQLYTKYFYDLYNYNLGIDFVTVPMLPLSTWCERQVDEMSSVFFNPAINNIENCTTMVRLTFHISDSTPPSEIFFKLYENWNVNGIVNHNQPQSQINYSIHFFRYYQRKTEYPNLERGYFRTIEEFCGADGASLVRRKKTLPRPYLEWVFGEGPK